jgi:mycothiol system anti-sigma-R factor
MNEYEDHNNLDIRVYLDGELRDQELEEFRAHLSQCPACRQEVVAEEELSRLLKQSQPLEAAPRALRQRVAEIIGGASSPAGNTPARLRQGVLKILARPLQFANRRFRNLQLITAVIVLIVAGCLLLPAIVQKARADGYIDAATDAHRSLVAGRLPLEIQSDVSDVVTGWFAGKVPFDFRLPSSGETRNRTAVYRLVGGRLVNYKEGYAALVSYQMQKQRISLLVASSKSARAYGGEEVPVNGLVFHYTKRENLNIISWTNHGLTYALVSSLPGSGKQSCLVCHQSVPNGGRFSAH